MLSNTNTNTKLPKVLTKYTDIPVGELLQRAIKEL